LFVYPFNSDGPIINVDGDDQTSASELRECPCPEEYVGSVDELGNPLPWNVFGFDCNSYGDMLELSVNYRVDGFDTQGPFESPDDWDCDYYIWVCRQ